MGVVQVELEFLPWLSERLGGQQYRSRHLKWQVAATEGEAVGELFARLANADAAFRELVFDPGRRCLGDQLVVVLNDRLLDLAGGLEAPLGEGDKLAIVPALAGGGAVAP